MCESRSRPEPNPLFGRLARRATPRSLPESRVKKLTMRSPSLNGQVCRTKASLTRADIITALRRTKTQGYHGCHFQTFRIHAKRTTATDVQASAPEEEIHNEATLSCDPCRCCPDISGPDTRRMPAGAGPSSRYDIRARGCTGGGGRSGARTPEHDGDNHPQPKHGSEARTRQS